MLYSVTGATGLLGNNLIRCLLKNGHRVRVSVRPGSDRRALNGLDLELVEGELPDKTLANSLVDGCDGLFHVAACIWLGKTQIEKSRQVNVVGSEVMANACLKNGIRMLHVSTVDTLAAGTNSKPATELDTDPAKSADSAYVISKREAERSLLEIHQQKGLDVVIVNPGLMFGPYDWKPSSGGMITGLKKNIPIVPGGGVSVADVRNVAAGCLAAMEKGTSGKRYILAGTNITYYDLWKMICKLHGKKGTFKKMRAPLAWIIGKSGDLVSVLKGHEVLANSTAINLGQNYNYYSSQRAADELGYDPGDLKKALKDAWEWLEANKDKS